MSLREQFEAWWKSQRAAYGINIAWQAYQAGHAVNADLLEELEYLVDKAISAGWHKELLESAQEAIKKARAE